MVTISRVLRTVPRPLDREGVGYRRSWIDAIPGYDEETRLQYAGGLPEDTGEESSLAE
jgi:hypothetical protein